MKTFLPAVASLGLALALPFTLQAQDTAPPVVAPEESAHARLVAVMSPDALHEASFANTVSELRRFYMENPDFVLLDKECPGLIDNIFEKSEDEMREYHWAEANAIRSLMLDLVTEYLTEEQANEGAALYGTPLGQKVIIAAGQNQNLQNTMESAVENKGGEVDRTAFDRDQRATTSKVLRTLTRAEIEEFGRLAMGSKFLPAFQRLNPLIQQRKFELLNSDRLSAYETRMQAAMQDAMNSHIEACN